ncbi:MAG TPA: hypothetical protein VK654_11800, partial [Nitrospirota bacterium]|nr:hypothetical protein [Nitrospirota bacterium]
MLRRILLYYLFSVSFLLLVPACSTIPVNTIQPPPATAKLRVYVQPLSSQNRDEKALVKRRAWNVSPYKEYCSKQREIVKDYLEDMGYYEVVSTADIEAALGADGEERLTRAQLENNDWLLVKKIARALHADYAMVMERSKRKGAMGEHEFVFINDLINAENGKKYRAAYTLNRSTRADYRERRSGIRATYREIFHNAKADMLETALRKAERFTSPPSSERLPEKKPSARVARRPQPAEEPEDADIVEEAGEDEGLYQAA